MNDKTRWGILACGHIANEFAHAVLESSSSELVAVSSRDGARARDFSKRYGGCRAYGGYEELLADPMIDAVYIATLHPFHHTWILKALAAGKHVLCEKPLTMNRRQAQEAFDVAREHGCLLREAFMYRHHPQTQQLVELVESRVIGEVRMIDANFCVNTGHQPNSRLQAKALGGGAILDLGCYPMSFARLIAGRARGELFADPLELKAVGHLDPETETDMWTSALVQFGAGIVAKLSCAMRVHVPRMGGVIYGDKGRIVVEQAWHCREHMRLHVEGAPSKTISADTTRPLFSYEIEAFSKEVAGQVLSPSVVGMSEADTLGNMGALDRWREEIGLRYAADGGL